jgi:hypothetical protein
MKMDSGDGGGGGHNSQLWLCGGEGNIETVSSGTGRRMGDRRADAGGVIIRWRLDLARKVLPSTGLVGWVWYELIRSAMLPDMGW